MKINETLLRDAAHPAAADAAKPLVLTALIEQANEAFAVAFAAEKSAIEALAKAEDGLVVAKLAADAAAHTPGADVYQAEVALEDAERRARVANRVMTGALHNREAARTAIVEATRAAHAPVVKEGARRMVAAAQAIEDSLKALNEAFVAYRTGERMVAIAAVAGGQGGGTIQWLIDGLGEVCAPTAAVELAKWVRLAVLEAPKVEG